MRGQYRDSCAIFLGNQIAQGYLLRTSEGRKEFPRPVPTPIPPRGDSCRIVFMKQKSHLALPDALPQILSAISHAYSRKHGVRKVEAIIFFPGASKDKGSSQNPKGSVGWNGLFLDLGSICFCLRKWDKANSG